MSTFHRPKVYRSTVGCCICKAKSSSSRFTDSKRYEDDFIECFQLSEQRGGEICNACVLLVKRWKKLPAGSQRNWSHVVDARSGPGTNKSLNKFHKRKPKLRANLVLKSTAPKKLQDAIIGKRKKHTYRKQENATRETSPASDPGEESDDLDDEDMDIEDSSPSSPVPSSSAKEPSPLLDPTYWIREEVCCGTVFRGRCGEVVVDPRFLKPCRGRTAFKYPSRPESPAAASKTVLTKDVDSSSDSGYDDYSSKDAKAAEEAPSEAPAPTESPADASDNGAASAAAAATLPTSSDD